MTIKEMAKVMDYLKTCYPAAWKDVDDMKVLAAWTDQFADYDLKTVEAAVKAFVATNTTPYPPVIGQIKAQVVKMTTHEIDPQEAWTHIRAAISNSGYHSQSEFDNLTPLEQRVVGSPRQLYDWGQMDVDTLDSVVASNIIRSLRARAEHERYIAALPNSVHLLGEPCET